MSRDHIRLEAGRASLVVHGRAVAQADASDLRALIVASSGNDIHATDEEFIVLELKSSLWVVPERTPGVAELLAAWAGPLASVPCFEAHCADLPVPWRKRAWLMPLPAPRLGAFPPDTAPRWARKEPVALSSLPLPGLAWTGGAP